MLAITNAVTGEMETAKVTVIVQRDTPKYKDEAFTIFFQAVNLAMIKKTKPITAKLLLYLFAEVDWKNKIDRLIDEICIDLDYKPRQVFTAIKELEEMNIIRKIPHGNDKRRYFIILNPLQSWKGKVKEREELMQEMRDANQLSLPFPYEEKNAKKRPQEKLPENQKALLAPPDCSENNVTVNEIIIIQPKSCTKND